jgi:hypothetical protein
MYPQCRRQTSHKLVCTESSTSLPLYFDVIHISCHARPDSRIAAPTYCSFACTTVSYQADKTVGGRVGLLVLFLEDLDLNHGQGT